MRENQKGFPINIKHSEEGDEMAEKKVHKSNKLKLYDQSI